VKTRPGKALIVCADDLGLSPGVNRGIEEAHQRGIVTATSIMATVPHLTEALDVLARNPGLDPGVHLCLGPGASVAQADQVPNLLGSDGRLRAGHAALWKALVTGTIKEAEVEREWRAQIEKVIEAGVTPTHLDSHGHVHFFPSLYHLTVRLALDYGIPAIRGGRPLVRPLGRRWWVWSILVVNWLLSRPRSERGAVASPRWLAGVPVTGRLSPAVLHRLFRGLPRGVVELTCHPGYEDEELRRSGDSPLPDRTAETQALSTVMVPDTVRLTTFAAEWGTAAEEHGR
jgi:predicted glycoside hydrolase/deacetylase ChbG (UPF0249 family)